MTMNPLVFVPLGFGYTVCANRVVAILRMNTKQTKSIIARAKKDGRYMDWTYSRKTASIIVLDDNTVIGCAFSPSPVYGRFMNACKIVQGVIEDIFDDDDGDTGEDGGEEE